MTKPVTIRIPDSTLKEIERYGFNHTEFIREAISRHLKTAAQEYLIRSYGSALESTRNESSLVNSEMYPASGVSNLND